MTARKGNAECIVEGCTRKELARGWCGTHYHRWRHTGDVGGAEARRAPNRVNPNQPCSVEGCDKVMHARGFCPAHLGRFKAYGDPLGLAPERPAKTVDDLRREAYEGAPGGTTSPKGYRYRSGRRGERYAEHRLVLEYILGRELYSDENPHHRNGDRGDNRPENLELWSTWQPSGQRVEEKVAWARELLARYEPEGY
jgi:hypothetical protein